MRVITNQSALKTPAGVFAPAGMPDRRRLVPVGLLLLSLAVAAGAGSKLLLGHCTP